jgi:Sigma-70, region 4
VRLLWVVVRSPAFHTARMAGDTQATTFVTGAAAFSVTGLIKLEWLSYRELADVIGIPIGTVMSRLSRARGALRGALTASRNSPAFQ